MEKMVILKQLLEEELLTKAEFDLLRKEVIDEMMQGERHNRCTCSATLILIRPS